MEKLPTVTELNLTIYDVKKYIAPNATDKELFMFMGIAKSYGLNPMKREIHFIKYGSAPASIVVGYEIYLKRAERTGKLDGWKCWIEKDELGEKAVIEIKRKDQSMPIRWEVYRKEFDKQQSTWKAMPTFMLKKVAIAQGFRLAFPDDLGGLPYLPEELPQTKDATSEALPTGDVEIVDEPPKEPMAFSSVAPQEEKPIDVVEEKQSKARKALEVKLKDQNWDRGLFKEWLFTLNRLEKKDGKLSMTNLPDKTIKSLLADGAWEWVEKHFNLWVDERTNRPSDVPAFDDESA